MKKIAFAAIASAATLLLAACGSSDPASEGAQADNVEMPAEETMQNVDASAAAPASDAAALPGADGTAPAADASATAPADPAAAKAAEDATKAAEKKM